MSLSVQAVVAAILVILCPWSDLDLHLHVGGVDLGCQEDPPGNEKANI